MVIPNALDEGDSGGNMPLTLGNKGNSLKRKHDEEEEPIERRTHRKHINYQYLNNPFLDEEMDEATYAANNYIFAIIASDEYTSLKKLETFRIGLNGKRQYKKKLPNSTKLGLGN